MIGIRREHSIGRPAAQPADVGDLDRRVAELARRQDGFATRRQLLALGMGAGVVRHRLRKGLLIEVHRGVYAVGHVPEGERSTLRAALLAVGSDALVSHRSGATWWALARGGREVTLTCPGRAPRSRDGLVVHTSKRLPATDVRWHRGLPVTSPARTIVDFAGDAVEAEVEHAIAEAQVLGLLRVPELEAAVAARPRHHGAAVVRRLIDAGAPPTRSELERRLRRIVRDAGLPAPTMNQRLGPYRPDAVWLDEQVAVETDGWAAHGHRRAFERDRARDAHLAALGYVVVRFTWRQLEHEPLLVATRIAQVLARRTAA